ncbi:hypothetical protein SNOG_04920 [Parastagonospora nodorum SN15]|uniref:Uncharacterized protein n=1 Tax=Phaeosphaeria nodorum (strain SN15 / ATCC MYA-4574 / FGSC 10173) TaxID=321614 RepID=Q0UTJ4_PHANO|nr:hypothetical protein SNOG_04920 [Parastagonospora nodorum SN15]EAT87311.1 hypothetical protein SNOG_04920 [Parastagonospora nodorum SN15]
MYTQDRKAGSGGKPLARRGVKATGQARGEKRALIERDAAFAAHLLPSTHLPTSRSPAAELDPPPSVLADAVRQQS